MTLRFVIPVHTRNVMNANFGNSRRAAIASARRDAQHRDLARLHTQAAMRRAGLHPADLVPAAVTVVRVSAGRLDAHDGLGSALKRVIDGIALALGVDDGGPFVTWRLEQAKAPPGVHGVAVTIEKDEPRARAPGREEARCG